VATEKYTSKYLDIPWTPQWPFGHGLSYTTFAYADLRLSADSMRAADSLVVTVSVRNSGTRPGDEVVQLYLRDEAASVTRPLRSLKGFGRVSLGPGEAREVRFTLRPEDLSLYDLTMRRVVEPGAFTVFVGGSSDGGLEGRFLVVGDTLVLAPPPPRLR
jgi:beta-glucosidase